MSSSSSASPPGTCNFRWSQVNYSWTCVENHCSPGYTPEQPYSDGTQDGQLQPGQCVPYMFKP